MRSEPRVLTVQPPWSWAIAHGGKDIENRTDCMSYEGQLFIHAGMRWSQRGVEDSRVIRAWRRAFPNAALGVRDVSDVMRHGHIVAVCQLVECHYDEGCCRPWGESQYPDSRTGKLQTQLVHMVLDDIVPLDDGPAARGRMGLWRPTVDIIEAVRAQL